MDLETTGAAKRRRGGELEDALLDAAWAQLVSTGYGGFTFDAIAERAGTSKPVLYRRWPNRHELVVAATQHFFDRGTRPIPDTGSLRGDVIELLTRANEARGTAVAVISVQLGTYYQESGTTPAELREQILRDRTLAMDTIVQRAVERGEISDSQLTSRIISLPLDLIRHEGLMTLRAVPVETVTEIVDTIFLPLVNQALSPESQAPQSVNRGARSEIHAPHP